ncbi:MULTISPECIES: GntR family transcriptional regulator [Inquilinus]|uniref:DNA-binding GntR family transcriptional regulator n=1 Tax=Inquilinus ginsengisoli TaxID=363840 RepID=A0ABU1JZU2_9PROT|nr:GntR family transcriptional regulator [Inquilinus ginsengisoli]MDR6294138.1 DNA-binding GntR family transcriptional regulator [Inquilinus ginsengisoli]
MDPNLIVDMLRHDIETRALPPDTVLRQEILATRFGVSRQPVRQALDRLLAEGLVVRRSDRGLAVAGLSAEDARELAALRILVEGEALRLSLPRLDARALRRAERLAEDLVEEEDPAAIEELDVAFHAALYAACGNARMLRLVDSLRREGRRSYTLQPPGSVFRATMAAQHESILAACRDGDSAAAIAALAAHLRAAVDLQPGDTP